MQALGDLRVLAVEQYGAGPWGTLQLADLGAEVIKIEDPRHGGDVGRYVPPHAQDEDSLFFETFNRNKRSISLDLAVPAGREVFHQLVGASDVVFSNLRGDVPERLGLRFADLEHVNPTIVCCSLSGFGMTGPRRAEPGYDYVMQGIAGWMSLTGEPGSPPTKSGLSLVDFSTGIVAAASILAAVHAARRDGAGLDCDVSLFDTAMSLTNYLATWHLTTGDEPTRTRRSAHPSIVPAQVFATSDGWITLQAGKDVFWRRLLQVLGEPSWSANPCFGTMAGRHANRDALLALLDAEFLRRTSAEWLQVLSAARIPHGPVRTLAEAFADPQVEARDLVLEVQHPSFGPVRQVRSTLRAGLPRTQHRRAPRRNEDADHVLGGLLGMSDRQRESLADRGAFGPP